MALCAVYGLIDAREGIVRYIGQTIQSLPSRLGGHLGKARRGSRGHLHCWLRSVETRGSKVRIIPLQLDAVWNESEVEWIARYRSMGAPLVNHTAGGMARSGYKLPAATIENLRSKVAEQWKSPDYRVKVLNGHARFWTTEQREQQAIRAAKQTHTDESRKRMSAGILAYYADPNVRAAQKARLAKIDSKHRIAALSVAMKTPEYRSKKRAQMTELWARRRAGLAPQRASRAC